MGSLVTVELTREEAELLIAVLTYATGAALVENPSIVTALNLLHPWRRALLMAYLRMPVNDLTDGNQATEAVASGDNRGSAAP